MKVYEIMEALSRMPAGEDVIVMCRETAARLISNPEDRDRDYIVVDFNVNYVGRESAIIGIKRTEGNYAD